MSRAIRSVNGITKTRGDRPGDIRLAPTPPPVFTLRDYQGGTIDEALDLLRRRDVLIESPTGSGKTMMARTIAAALLGVRRGRIRHAIIVAPQCDIEHGFTCPGDVEMEWGDGSRDRLVIPGGPGGFVRRARHQGAGSGASAILEYLAEKNPGYALATTHSAVACLVKAHGARIPEDLRGCLLVVDEAHHAPARVLSGAVDLWSGRGARLLFLTATPYRADDREVCRPGMAVIRRSVAEHTFGGVHAPGFIDHGVIPVGKRGDKVTGQEFQGVRISSDPAIRKQYCKKAVAKWLASGKQKTIVAVPVLGGGCASFVKMMFDAFDKAGARVLDATGQKKDKQREVIAALEAERDRPYKKSQYDVVIGVQRVREGFDWPHCSAVLCIGIPGSIGAVTQLLGRAMRFKPKREDKLGCPPEFRNVASIHFLVPCAGGEALKNLSVEHSRQAVMAFVFLADYQVGREFLVTRAISSGLGVRRTRVETDKATHGLPAAVYAGVYFAMATAADGAKRRDGAVTTRLLMDAGSKAYPDVPVDALNLIALEVIAGDGILGPPMLKRLEDEIRKGREVEPKNKEVVRDVVAKVVEGFRDERLGEVRQFAMIGEQVHRMTGEGMRELAERMASSTPYEFMGQMVTLTELSRWTGINKYTLLSRLERMSVEEAVAMGNQRGTRRLILDGVEYSQNGLARKIGITARVLCQRLKKMSVEEAVAMKNQRQPRRLMLDGVEYSLMGLAWKIGISQGTLRDRLKKMSVEEAVRLSLDKRSLRTIKL